MLDYIFTLGVIYIIFWIWNVIFTLVMSTLFTLLRINWGKWFVKAFNYYIFVSLTAMATLIAMRLNPSMWSLVLMPLIGVFIIYMSLAQDSYDKEKQAVMQQDYEMLKDLRFDGIFGFGALALYIVSLFVPIIITNPLTIWLFDVTNWAYNLTVIGWILRIIGAIFLLGVIWQGIMASLAITSIVIEKFQGKYKYT